MRICDLTTLYIDGGEGGVNTYLTEKARYLADHGNGHQHTIIVSGAQNTQQSLFNSTLYSLKSPRFYYNPQHRILTNFRRVRELLVAVQPDIIEVDCVYFLGYWARAAMRQRRVPLVGFYHTHLPSFYARPLTQHFGQGIARLMEKGAWAYVTHCTKPLDKILVSSADMYQRLLERSTKKVEQVPLGVNLELFQLPPTNGSPTSKQHPTILYVGRLSQEKDLDVLFAAFHLLSQRGTYHLRIVGDGPLRAKTEHFVHMTPHTSYSGSVPYGTDLAAIYATADILALPSRNETFGLTILEALACGLPVVATNQGGPSNLLCSCVGALATPGDPVDFADKLASVLAKRPAVLECRAHAEQHYSWDKTFTTLLNIYENLTRTTPG